MKPIKEIVDYLKQQPDILTIDTSTTKPLFGLVYFKTYHKIYYLPSLYKAYKILNRL